MEIKLNIEDDNQAIRFWVDSESGALCIDTEISIMEIPNETANELIEEIQKKLFNHYQKNKRWFQ